MRRNTVLVLCSMIPGFLFGFAYLVFSEAKYTAEAAVLSWAGLRGAVGLVLALVIQADERIEVGIRAHFVFYVRLHSSLSRSLFLFLS